MKGEGRNSGFVFDQWLSKVSLTFSPSETSIYGAELVLIHEAVAIALTCGFTSGSIKKLPQLLPSAILRMLALSSSSSSTDGSQILEHAFGTYPNNGSIPITEEHLAPVIQRFQDNANDGFYAITSVHACEANGSYYGIRFSLAGGHGSLILMPFKENNLFEEGFSLDRMRNCRIKVTRSDTYSSTNWARVKAEVQFLNLPNAEKIQMTFTFLDANSNSVD